LKGDTKATQQRVEQKLVSFATPFTWKLGHNFCSLWSNIEYLYWRYVNVKMSKCLQHGVRVARPTFRVNWSKICTTYTGKICPISITGGHINFILDSWHENDQKQVRQK